MRLANRLRTAGCAVDLTGTDWHATGDFIAPPPPGDGLPLERRLPSGDSARNTIDFDLKYFNKGGNRIDKLQVINRGTETAYDVALTVPENAALDLRSTDVETITKIPGGGRSVTVDVFNTGRMMGWPRHDDVFDVTITARAESGEQVIKDVFLDLNG